MKRILLIDDMRNAEAVGLLEGEQVLVIKRTFESGLVALATEQFDELLLDHDLGEEKTGYDIAKWLETHTEHAPESLKCVSSNGPGRANIERAFRQIRSVKAMWKDAREEHSTAMEKYDSFWKELVEQDGVLNKQLVANELADFSVLIRSIGTIYMDLTGGVASKPMTMAEAILSLNEQALEEAYDRGYKDAEDDLKPSEPTEDDVSRRHFLEGSGD